MEQIDNIKLRFPILHLEPVPIDLRPLKINYTSSQNAKKTTNTVRLLSVLTIIIIMKSWCILRWIQLLRLFNKSTWSNTIYKLSINLKVTIKLESKTISCTKWLLLYRNNLSYLIKYFNVNCINARWHWTEKSTNTCRAIYREIYIYKSIRDISTRLPYTSFYGKKNYLPICHSVAKVFSYISNASP